MISSIQERLNKITMHVFVIGCSLENMDTGQNLANFLEQEKLFEFERNSNKFKYLIKKTKQSNLLEKFVEKEIDSLKG